ncbi:hypothetical protein E2553_42560 [Paraburkholderia dipogonis]|uniref:Uncharacterized protein n=1 Tax=Paraburkholderia dipogonis TaxID=1211383 RepID=A0A4Y8MG55_9BURK|nr:hypothetical protein E2553_42560 [Paraburkholderia dipogonis]
MPVTKEMMMELSTYRRTRGLPAPPSPGEDTPLVPPIGQSLKPLTRAAFHWIVKNVWHASLTTTGQCLHLDDDRRHRETMGNTGSTGNARRDLADDGQGPTPAPLSATPGRRQLKV